MKKHTVVIGYGMKGRSAVQALMDQGYPAGPIVVVDQNGANIKAATADGCVGVLGDARREEVLRQAAVPSAERVIVAADRDDTSVLVTLTARRLAPDGDHRRGRPRGPEHRGAAAGRRGRGDPHRGIRRPAARPVHHRP